MRIWETLQADLAAERANREFCRRQVEPLSPEREALLAFALRDAQRQHDRLVAEAGGGTSPVSPQRRARLPLTEIQSLSYFVSKHAPLWATTVLGYG
jgi:hypothetical protein